jgi:glucokinase
VERREVARRPLVVGVDIGGTGTSAVLFDGERAVARAQAPTPAKEGGPAMARTAAGLVRTVVDELEGATLAGVGVGAAGVIHPVTGTVLAASDSFRDWAGFPLARELVAELGVPVVVENDVNAFALGEARIGAARGLADVFAMTLGTGVGGALVLDGTLYRGPSGAAGEIGHVAGFGGLRCTCGGTGHLETLASGTSIVRSYARRSGSACDGGAGEVAERARSGDRHAQEAFAEAGHAVGRAAVLVATLLDVADIVVGGGVTGAWDLLAPAIQAGILAEPPVSGAAVRVVPASLADDAVALGAACAAWDRLMAPSTVVSSPV